jgi:hypothetical protein
MKPDVKRISALENEPREDMHLLGTFAVLMLILSIVSITFYLLVDNYA